MRCTIGIYNLNQSVGFKERSLYCLACTLECAFGIIRKFSNKDFVHDHVYIVPVVFADFDALTQSFFHTIHDHLLIALAQKIIEQLVILAFAPDDDRRGNLYFFLRNTGCEFTFFRGKARPCRGFGLFLRLFHNLKHLFQYFFIRKFAHLATAYRTMRMPNACIEYAEVIVYFGYRRHR